MCIRDSGYTEPFYGRFGAAQNAGTPNCDHISDADASVSTTRHFIRLITQSQPPNGSLSLFVLYEFYGSELGRYCVNLIHRFHLFFFCRLFRNKLPVLRPYISVVPLWCIFWLNLHIRLIIHFYGRVFHRVRPVPWVHQLFYLSFCAYIYSHALLYTFLAILCISGHGVICHILFFF